MDTLTDPATMATAAPPLLAGAAGRRLLRNPTVVIGAAILAVILLLGLAAPWLGTVDPVAINPSVRNKLPGFEETVRNDNGSTTTIVHRMGTDTLGRDVYSRTLYGARVSLLVGAAVATISVALGLAIGLFAGYVRWLDGPVMRLMDGLMAIPAILLAIALVSLWTAGIVAVIVAIVIPEIPRVVRLVRAIVLSVREEPYVESAILVEAILSFLGVGIPPETPTWGNIMAEGRALFRIFPHNILYPGVFLALTVLAVNMLGDGLRDALDPRMKLRR